MNKTSHQHRAICEARLKAHMATAIADQNQYRATTRSLMLAIQKYDNECAQAEVKYLEVLRNNVIIAELALANAKTAENKAKRDFDIEFSENATIDMSYENSATRLDEKRGAAGSEKRVNYKANRG
jgi:hypothetical protein